LVNDRNVSEFYPRHHKLLKKNIMGQEQPINIYGTPSIVVCPNFCLSQFECNM
jgi:hypothetical protein